MGKITTEIDQHLGLTRVTAVGTLTIEDFLTWIKTYYSNSVTRHILWDFSKGNISSLSTENFQQMASHVVSVGEKRKGGKTALVFDTDLDFGLGRMFEAFSENQDVPFEYCCFRNLDDALKWLTE